jgi:acetyl esterase/lipase
MNSSTINDLTADIRTLEFAAALRKLLGPARLPTSVQEARATWEVPAVWPDALVRAGGADMILPEEPPTRCISNRVIRLRAHAVSVRVLLPEKVDGIYVHMHGGGWATKLPIHYDCWNWRLARSCNLAVVSIDYRRAPEHPYPAPVDDCEVTVLWTILRGHEEFGTGRVVVGGDSSGASLAAVTLQRLRDRHDCRQIIAADLLYGMYDLSLTPSVRRWRDTELGVSREILAWLVSLYVQEQCRQDPDVSPLYGDLQGMPPALLSVGTLDPLLDDTLFMQARWLSAGNSARLALYPGGTHNFDRLPLPLADQCWQARTAFLRERLTAG